MMRERGYFQAKKGFSLVIALMLLTNSLFAQTKTGVILKFSKQEGQMRIVFEAREQFIEKTKTTTSQSQIKIEFPGPFDLTAPKNLPFETVSKGNLLIVNLNEQSDIKISRLSSPSRLVVDIKLLDTKSADKQPASILSKVFVLDAGHGGYDFGIIAAEMKEKDLSLSLAKDLGEILSKRGKKVFLTRKVDQYLSLLDRIKFINQKKPEVFISLHSSLSENYVLYVAKFKDKGSDKSDKMVDLYSLSSRQKRYIGKSRTLSDCIGKAIKDSFKEEVIYREMPLPLLTSAEAPSVLIEYPSPRFVAYDQQMKTSLINAIINGIAAYGQ
jgi:N-acetylmuramoyl-L-alanine amidase